jgi:transcriptional regulator with XRE-family HTH domain
MSDFEEIDAKIDRQIQQLTQKLRDKRRKSDISQIDLSYMANLSQNQVNAIETGKRVPNLHTLLKICNALDISPREALRKLNKAKRAFDDSFNEILNLTK